MAKVNYNSETREQVIKLVLKGEKSANQIAKEFGIGPNTVGRWVNEYRKEHNLPSYREERRIRNVSVEELPVERFRRLDFVSVRFSTPVLNQVHFMADIVSPKGKPWFFTLI